MTKQVTFLKQETNDGLQVMTNETLQWVAVHAKSYFDVHMYTHVVIFGWSSVPGVGAFVGAGVGAAVGAESNTPALVRQSQAQNVCFDGALALERGSERASERRIEGMG